MLPIIESTWKDTLSDYLNSPDYQKTSTHILEAYRTNTVCPCPANIYRTFELTHFNQVRVVILGQDPYIHPNQATGLAFSVPTGEQIPPSLKNIFHEIESDLGHSSACLPHGDLTSWSSQGVLLLNSILTVEAGRSGSHRSFGWQNLTDECIRQLSKKRRNLVFILWGNYAKSKISLIDSNKHLILDAPHPSPLSVHRGFFGSKHFSRANEYLAIHGYQPIDW